MAPRLACTAVCVAAVAFAIVGGGRGVAAASPQQIYLSPTGAQDEMMVSFAATATASSVQPAAVVHYWAAGQVGPPQVASGVSAVLSTHMSKPLREYNVVLTNLLPNTTYSYVAGGVGSGAPTYSFTTPPLYCRGATNTSTTCTSWAPRTVAIAGDFGYDQPSSLPKLLRDAAAGRYGLFILPGDLAYNLDSNNGAVGSAFLNQMQPLIATLPFTATVGNHEDAYNFTIYDARFRGPALFSNSGSPRYYSFNDGIVHWVAVDAELYESGNATAIAAQAAWLTADLAAVNRTATPWVFAFGHRSNWMFTTPTTALEDILVGGGVALYFVGHQHNYQRILPGTATNPESGCVSHGQTWYTNCARLAIVVVGTAGSWHGLSNNVIPTSAMLAYYSQNYGVGYLTVYNETTVAWVWEQSAWGNGTAFGPTDVGDSDAFWMVQSANPAPPVPYPIASPTSSPRIVASAPRLPSLSPGAVAAAATAAALTLLAALNSRSQ